MGQKCKGIFLQRKKQQTLDMARYGQPVGIENGSVLGLAALEFLFHAIHAHPVVHND